MNKSFQARSAEWVDKAFGPEALTVRERSWRFCEESIELMQATDMTAEEVKRMVDAVYSRPSGQAAQEIGGVMMTLVTLAYPLRCMAVEEGERELARVNQPDVIEKCRQKNRVAVRGIRQYAVEPAWQESAMARGWVSPDHKAFKRLTNDATLMVIHTLPGGGVELYKGNWVFSSTDGMEVLAKADTYAADHRGWA
jgi:hypothetical protein